MSLPRQLSAEFLATLVLMLFGLGVNAQVSLGAKDVALGAGTVVDRVHGDFFTINMGWGIAVALGAFVGGGVSGAHMNPAVSIALAVRGQFAWRNVLPFVAVQVLAAFLASAIVCATYYEATNAFEAVKAGAEVADGKVPWTNATAGIYGTYPREFAEGKSLSNWAGLLDQIVGTALLLICVCALSDDRNIAPKSNLAPLAVGSVVLMIGMSFGSNCGYAINPARDFAPRLFTFVAGWPEVFSRPNGSWWTIPIIGPIIGAVLGAMLYDLAIRRLHPRMKEESEA